MDTSHAFRRSRSSLMGFWKFALLALPVMSGCSTEKPVLAQRAKGDLPVAVVPIIGIDSTAPRVLDIAMINVSSVPFRYLAGADDRSWAELQIVLLANGSRIAPTRAPYVPLTKDQMRVLEPRGRLIQHVDLASQFGRLAPGEYTVGVSAHVSPALARDFGLTEVSLNETIALFVVPTRPAQQPSETPGNHRYLP